MAGLGEIFKSVAPYRTINYSIKVLINLAFYLIASKAERKSVRIYKTNFFFELTHIIEII